MALKPGRKITDGQDISFFMSETAEAGGIVVFSGSGGLGEAMDDPTALVVLPTSTGGNAAGILCNDVVNVDLTRYKLNEHKDEVQVGSKVTILRNGVVTTNRLVSGNTPTAGASAYWNATGLLTTTSGSARIGQFLGRKDTDGYVKVEVNIPSARV